MARVELDTVGLQKYALEKCASGLRAGGLYLVGEIKGEVSTQGTGREYRRGSRVHIASAPGESPASDTGRLLGSIDIGDLEISRNEVKITVGANTDYAAALEVGTEKMAARPFMATTLYSRMDGIRTVFKANT